VGGFLHFKNKDKPVEASPAKSTTQRYVSPYASMPASSSDTYSCDGRQHCSQMHSCNEATYFLRNCPNTKMDGDHDGIPCEDQWCSW